MVQVWAVEDAGLVSSFDLQTQVSSRAHGIIIGVHRQCHVVSESKLLGSPSLSPPPHSLPQCSSVCVLASCSAVAVGSESGHLLVLSLLRPRRPALVSRHHLYHCPVEHLAHDREDQFLAAAGKDSPDVYLMDARPSSNFQVLGRLGMLLPICCNTVKAMQATLYMLYVCVSLNCSCRISGHPSVTGPY